MPSNWELQGFGRFTYQTGPPAGQPEVQGQYKRTFPVPAGWADKRVFLVFESVMTDTQVRVNGQSTGPMHQGGFYRFQYEITSLLKFGADNLLEVTVDEESGNASINGAERRGDYWNYAGIYRPVLLEAFPAEFIERTAINAKADGSLGVDVFRNGTGSADSVEAQVIDLKGRLSAPLSLNPSPPVSSRHTCKPNFFLPGSGPPRRRTYTGWTRV